MSKHNKKTAPTLGDVLTVTAMITALGGLAMAKEIKEAFEAVDQSITEATSRPVAPEPYCTIETNGHFSRASVYQRYEENEGHRLYQSSGHLYREGDKGAKLVPGLTGTFVASNNTLHIYKDTSLFASDDDSMPVVGDINTNDGTKIVVTSWKKVAGKDVAEGTCSLTGAAKNGTVWENMPVQSSPLNAL